MVLLFYALFLCGTLLFLVTAAAVLTLAERRWPAFSRWLDRHVGQPEGWREW